MAFAADDLRAALATSGLPEASRSWVVDLSTAEEQEGLHPEAYSIVCHPRRHAVLVQGGGTVGTMYGGLRLAELLRHDAVGAIEGTAHPLSRIPNITVDRPLLELRGLKMNAPLDARTPSYGDAGDSPQRNIAAMWDMDFWQEHLDHMAKHRYNLLSVRRTVNRRVPSYPLPPRVTLPSPVRALLLADLVGQPLAVSPRLQRHGVRQHVAQ